ncbi:MAG: hypothetical protein PSN44_02675 [Gammaproteobacteria bacterium]|nr:hypothetical protein [Gammaproteobacteria bacterium]
MKKIWLVSILSYGLLIFGSNANAVTGFSNINNEIFDNAHLKNIKEEGTLSYVYKKEHFVDGSREDTIDLVLTNVRNTGRKDTHIDFFTGKYNRPYQDRENQKANSVVVFFLEYDVRELAKTINSSRPERWHYLQKKVKWQLARGATKNEIEVEYNGTKVPASQYMIRPYINDPKKADFPLYANKYYIFTLSDEIPGAIYQVRTIVPDGDEWQEGDEALIDESVTFVGFTVSE